MVVAEFCGADRESKEVCLPWLSLVVVVVIVVVFSGMSTATSDPGLFLCEPAATHVYLLSSVRS